jgi:trehalose/maltose hydrolase-like predicted phosphorylase
MAAWVLCRAIEVLDRLSGMRRTELTTRLGISAKEIARWNDISRRMYVPFHDEGIISQFEGYDALRELDWPAYRSFRRRSLESCSRVWAIRSAAIRSRRPSPIMLHAHLTVPPYAVWFTPGSWRVPTGHAQ